MPIFDKLRDEAKDGPNPEGDLEAIDEGERMVTDAINTLIGASLCFFGGQPYTVGQTLEIDGETIKYNVAVASDEFEIPILNKDKPLQTEDK